MEFGATFFLTLVWEQRILATSAGSVERAELMRGGTLKKVISLSLPPCIWLATPNGSHPVNMGAERMADVMNKDASTDSPVLFAFTVP